MLPTPKQLQELFPSPGIISDHRQQARTLFQKQNRFLLVVGPCSLHNPQEALTFADHLSNLSKKLTHTFLIMRAYFEKPRTSLGWKGLLYDPHLDGSDDIQSGLTITRELLAKLAEKIPLACEFVDPYLAPYFEDLITWGFIGARTSASQIHRQLASSLSFPVGFKNSTGGNIQQAIDAVTFAQTPQTIPALSPHGHLTLKMTDGNPFTHIVLRGSNTSSNYHNLHHTKKLLQASALPSKIFIDCSHGNSQKEHRKQKEVFLDLLAQTPHLLGMMLESNLYSGNQPLPENPSLLQPGISITDPCLGLEETVELILTLDQTLKDQPRAVASTS